MQSDVVHDDAFPELISNISNAFDRDVKIKILTRDLKTRGEKEIEWIQKLAKKMNKEQNLSIVDYHLFDESGKVLSSTHAKLIISDNENKTSQVGLD